LLAALFHCLVYSPQLILNITGIPLLFLEKTKNSKTTGDFAKSFGC
jgi:hypothetical protein